MRRKLPLAAFSIALSAVAQPPVVLPPSPELDRAVMESTPGIAPRPQASPQGGPVRGDPRARSQSSAESLPRSQGSYSRDARVAGLEGRVELNAFINKDGSVGRVDVIKSLGLGLDEKAIEAVPKSLPPQPVPGQQFYTVEFHLAKPLSRWHLIGISFFPPEGVAAPRTLQAFLPPGAGVSATAIDEARVVAATGRTAWASVSFVIDERGMPGSFVAERNSERTWGPEAIAVLRSWRFSPAIGNGKRVAVPCTVELAWGARDINVDTMAQLTDHLTTPGTSEEIDGAAPKLLFLPAAEYTAEARAQHAEGTVFVSVMVGLDGAAKDAVVARSFRKGASPLGANSRYPVLTPGLGYGLEQKALDAVAGAHFQTAIVNGRPSALRTVVEVNFRLP